MQDENHRRIAIRAYSEYEGGVLKVETFPLSQLGPTDRLPPRETPHLVYVLRIGKNVDKNSSVAAIVNRTDPLGVLYIGGHESGKCTGRYNLLLDSCRQAEAYFKENGSAFNDRRYKHTVAGSLTTSLLASDFRISDCIIDLISGENGYDELEFLIGYQERFHHLPPWNATRKGASAWRPMHAVAAE